MADPHHLAELDSFDRLTVRLYRFGLALAALGVVAEALVRLAGFEGDLTAWMGVNVGVALAAANMHLYAKQIRWLIGASCLLGLVLQVGAAALEAPGAPWVQHAGLGFVFVSLSGFALKEQFCFRIPGLRLVPLFLAASLIPLLAAVPRVAGAVLLPAGVVLCVLAWQKTRMPLHFDIGDKSKYQI